MAIVNREGEDVLDLRRDWLPREIYGDTEYNRRVAELTRRRYYGRDAQDKAGILRYTKVSDALLDLADIPKPSNERELAWLLSFYWNADQACNSIPELAMHRGEGRRPDPKLVLALQQSYEAAVARGLDLPQSSRSALSDLGIRDPS